VSRVLLSSGGMDSYLVAHLPEMHDAIHVFVDVGQRYAHHEREAALRLFRHLHLHRGWPVKFVEVNASNFARHEHSTGIIPFRNAELILNAAQYGTEIYLGVIADEINSDKSEEFLRAMETVLNISHRKQYWTEGKTFTMHTPLRCFTKAEAIKNFLRDKSNSFSVLKQSVSCYSEERHCGKCASCFKRWVALTVATGTDHGSDFIEHPGVYFQTLDMGGYTPRRRDEILRAVEIASRKRA
jgi:7-cyano-7-deazaguanine synthase